MHVRFHKVLRGVTVGVCTIAVAGVFVAAGLWFTVENYFYPAPYISTDFTEAFTWEAYDAVRTGMTANDVQLALGMPFEHLLEERYRLGDEYLPYYSSDDYGPEDDTMNGTCWNYARQGAGITAWIAVHICFDPATGLVNAKNKRVHYD